MMRNLSGNATDTFGKLTEPLGTVISVAGSVLASMKKSYQLLVVLALLLFAAPAEAQKLEYCVVCRQGPLIGTVWIHEHGTICTNCVKRKENCSICGLPIMSNYLKTKDGRYICPFEKNRVVVNPQAAKQLFNQVVATIQQITGNRMRLRSKAPDVQLFDVDYWNTDKAAGMRRNGFAQSRRTGSAFTHNIILLSGLMREELAAVCAHEYTHCWINENKNREIEGDTIEGICELIAYKVCQRAGWGEQMEEIKANPYTKGRILTMIEADKQVGLAKVLGWVRAGKNATVTLPRPPSIKGVNAPNKALLLNAVTRTQRGYRAVINGVAFYAGELKRIRYLGRSTSCQCLKVTSISATIKLNNGASQTLTLR